MKIKKIKSIDDIMLDDTIIYFANYKPFITSGPRMGKVVEISTVLIPGDKSYKIFRLTNQSDYFTVSEDFMDDVRIIKFKN